MIEFIVGAIVGSALSLFIVACCVAAGKEDEAAERTVWPEDNRSSGLLEDD